MQPEPQNLTSQAACYFSDWLSRSTSEQTSPTAKLDSGASYLWTRERPLTNDIYAASLCADESNRSNASSHSVSANYPEHLRTLPCHLGIKRRWYNMVRWEEHACVCMVLISMASILCITLLVVTPSILKYKTYGFASVFQNIRRVREFTDVYHIFLSK